jgi:hypothetical protein
LAFKPRTGAARVAQETEALKTTVDDVRAEIEARVKRALDEALARPRQEIAEPDGWWNLYAMGPIQFTSSPGPVLPHQVIKVGETGFVATVMFLNPFHILSPGISAADVLSSFALPYEIQYQTGNLTTWTLGPANLNAVSAGWTLVPNQYFYVDVLGFTANTPGLYEMNISARILGATPPYASAPQFAGYARAVVDFDADLFLAPAPGMQYDTPIRFQVYP